MTTSLKSVVNLPVELRLLILDYFDWSVGDVHNSHNLEVTAYYDKKGNWEFVKYTEWDRYKVTFHDIIGQIYGKFSNYSNENEIFLVRRYGLRFVIYTGEFTNSLPAKCVKIKEIVPGNMLGCEIAFENDSNCDLPLSLVDFSGVLGLQTVKLTSWESDACIGFFEQNLATLETLDSRGSQSSWSITKEAVNLINSSQLRSLHINSSVSFASPDVISSFFSTQLTKLSIGDCPSTELVKFNNTDLKCLSLTFRMHKVGNDNPILKLLMGHLQQQLGGDQEMLGFLGGLNIEMQQGNKIDMRVLRDSFCVLRRVWLNDVSSKHVRQFLDGNKTVKDVFLKVSDGGSIEPFENYCVEKLALETSNEKHAPFIDGLLQSMKKLRALSIRVFMGKGGGLGSIMGLLKGTSNMADVGWKYFGDGLRSVAKGLTKLELILPSSSLCVTQFPKLFPNLIHLGLSCLNFSELLEPLLKNSKRLEHLTTINMFKVKHAAAISKFGKNLKSLHVFEALTQAMQIAKANCVSIKEIVQDSRSFDGSKVWRRETETEDKGDYKAFPTWETSDIEVANEVQREYGLIAPYYGDSKYWERYSKARKLFENSKMSCEDKGMDDCDEDWVQKNSLPLAKCAMNIAMKKEVLEHLCKYFCSAQWPSKEEKESFGKIVQSCWLHYFENDYDRTDTWKSRIYSLVGKGEYFDIIYIDHHRARSTYRESFRVLSVIHSKDGEERPLLSEDYNMGNFEKKEFNGTKLLEEIKVILFGNLFPNVDIFRFLELIMIVSECPTEKLNWVKAKKENTFRVDMRPHEDEDSDGEDDDDEIYGFSSGSKKTVYGDKGANFNFIIFQSEIMGRTILRQL